MAKKPEDPQDYIARKEYKKAIAILKDRVGKAAKNAPLRLMLADTMVIDNQIDESIREYKVLGAQYTDEGFLVKAIAMYKKILKLRPGSRDVEDLLTKLSDRREGSPALKPKTEVPVKQPEARIEEPEPEPEPEPAPQPEPEPEPVDLMNSQQEEPPKLEIETKLFKDLSRDEFQQIVSKLALKHFEEDTIVVMEGDPGDSLFIIVRGQVRVLTRDARDKEVSLANLGEGDFFGEVSLLTGKPRTATIITNLDSELLELKKQDFDEIISRYPHVRKVVEDFHQERAYKTIEAMIQSLRDED